MAAEDAWPEDIPIWIDGSQKWMTGLTRRTTCDDVIYALLYARSLLDTDSTDNYAVFERWRTVERPLQGRTKIVKVWSAWGAEQPNVQLLVQRLDDYFIPTDNARARRRHRRSARQRARHCRCSIGSRTPCTKCSGNAGGTAGTGSRSKAVEQLTRHLIKQERHLQDLKRRVLDTERQIAQHEARQHARRVQRDGRDYVQDSYLIRHRLPGSRSGSGSGSSDHSSACGSGGSCSGSCQSLDSLLLAVGEEDLDEYLQLCEDLHEVYQRLEQVRYTQSRLAKEIEAEVRSQHQSRDNPKHCFPRDFVKDAQDHRNRDTCGGGGGGAGGGFSGGVSSRIFNGVDDFRKEKKGRGVEGSDETQLETLQVQLTRAVTANVLQHQQELDVVKEMQVWEARVRDRKRKIRQLLHQLDWCHGNENDDDVGGTEVLESGQLDSRTYQQNMSSGESAQLTRFGPSDTSERLQHASFDPTVHSGKMGGRTMEYSDNVQCLDNKRINDAHLSGSSPTSVESVQTFSLISAEGKGTEHSATSRVASASSLHSPIARDRAPPPLSPVKARSRSKERNERRERPKPPVPQPRSHSGTRQKAQQAAETLFTTRSSDHSPLDGAAPPLSLDPLTPLSSAPITSLAASASSDGLEQCSGSNEHFRESQIGRGPYSTSAPQPQREDIPQINHTSLNHNDSSTNFSAGSSTVHHLQNHHQQLSAIRAGHYSSFGEGGGHPLELLFSPSSKELYSSTKDDSGVASTSSDSSTDSGLLLFDDPGPLSAGRHTAHGPGAGQDVNAVAVGGPSGEGMSVRFVTVPLAPSPLPDSFLDVSLSYADCDDVAYGRGIGVVGDGGKNIGYGNDANYSVVANGGGEGGKGYSKGVNDAEMTDIHQTRSSRLSTANNENMNMFTDSTDTHVTDSKTELLSMNSRPDPSRSHDYNSPNLKHEFSLLTDPAVPKSNNSSSSSFAQSDRSNNIDISLELSNYPNDSHYYKESKQMSERSERKADSVFAAGIAFEQTSKRDLPQGSQQRVSADVDDRFLDTVPMVVNNGRSPSPQPVSIISTGKHNKRHVGLNGHTATPRPGKSVRFAENMTSWAWCARHEDDYDDDDDDDAAETRLGSLYGENMLVTLV